MSGWCQADHSKSSLSSPCRLLLQCNCPVAVAVPMQTVISSSPETPKGIFLVHYSPRKAFGSSSGEEEERRVRFWSTWWDKHGKNMTYCPWKLEWGDFQLDGEGRVIGRRGKCLSYIKTKLIVLCQNGVFWSENIVFGFSDAVLEFVEFRLRETVHLNRYYYFCTRSLKSAWEFL